MSKNNKGDITIELMSLKTLEGAAFGAKLREIAGRKEFHALPESPFIYSIGGGNQLSNDPDYPSLLMTALKAVEHGYRVFMLPNPHGLKTPDFIFERRGVYKLFDLKNISGKKMISRTDPVITPTSHTNLFWNTDKTTSFADALV